MRRFVSHCIDKKANDVLRLEGKIIHNHYDVFSVKNVSNTNEFGPHKMRQKSINSKTSLGFKRTMRYGSISNIVHDMSEVKTK